MQAKWYIMINPEAGGGRAKKEWVSSVEQKLQKAGIDFEAVFSSHIGHGIILTIQAIQNGYRHIIAVGGDGTFNEVINGILLQKTVPTTDITLAMLPLGTGNDWIKTMKIPTNIDDAIGIVKKGNIYLHDAGFATYYEGKAKKERYFLNVAGTGFDAYVAQRMGNASKRFGKLTYFIELAKGLFKYSTIPVLIKTKVAEKSREVSAKIFTVAIGNCKYFGSGMKIAPDAVPNDGLFDITLIKDISKMGVIGELKNLYAGTFVSHPQVEQFRTTSLSIDAPDHAIYLQLDGELLGHGPIELEMVPQALKVLVA